MALLLAGCENSSPPPGTPPGTIPTATFAKSYGDDERYNAAIAATQTRDGGYAFVGHWGGYPDELRFGDERSELSDYSSTQYHDVWIGKLDANGDLEWQRNLGERDRNRDGQRPDLPNDVGREFKRTAPMRRTLDGGYIEGAIESSTTYRPEAPEIRFRLSNRFALRKFSAQGNLEWERSYSSGPWRDYDYVPVNRFSDDYDPEAFEVVLQDVWPAADGTYWIVGVSRATVRATGRYKGGPATFEGDDPYSYPPRGNIFDDAQSTVVFHVDTDGNLIGSHRFTEGQFSVGLHTYYDPGIRPAIIRSDAQGRGILVRILPADRENADNESVLFVDRLGTNAQPIDRFEYRVVTNDLERLANPVDLIQTDDLVGLPIPARDGIADDGYLVLLSRDPEAGPVWLFKLGSDLSLTWHFQRNHLRHFNAIVQSCVPVPVLGYGCSYVYGGETNGEGSLFEVDDAGRFTGRFTLLPQVGRVIAMRFDATAREIVALGRVDRRPFDLRIIRLTPSLDPVVAGEVSIPYGFGVEEAHFDRDGSFVVNGDRLFQPDGTRSPFRFTRSHDDDSEEAVGLVEVAPNSLVFAANANTYSQRRARARYAGEYAKQVWLVRLTDGRVEWQKVYGEDPDRETLVRAIVAAPDGGFVLHVQTRDLSCDVNDSDPQHDCGSVWLRHPLQARLVKFSAAGEVEWESPVIDSFPYAKYRAASPESLRAIADHYVVSTGEGKLTRINAQGEIVWRAQLRHVDPGVEGNPVDILSLDGVDSDADGSADDGYIALVDSRSPSWLLTARLNDSGEVLWESLLYPFHSLDEYDSPGLQLDRNRARIRSTPDGGFIVAGDDSRVVAERGPDDPQQRPTWTPIGRRNIVLVKLDHDGGTLWWRGYGGAYDETLFDLVALRDGGLLIAGASESMGSWGDAWILRLDPQGRIAQGCQALLAEREYSRPINHRQVSVHYPTRHLLSDAELPLPLPSLSLSDTTAVARTDPLNIARQCSGRIYPPVNPEPTPEYTLTVVQAGQIEGPVTSTPRGIACGAGGQQFCSARFPSGSVVRLTADVGTGSFTRWDRTCAEDTGDTNPLCIIVMDSDQTVPVIFGEPAPRIQYDLHLDVQANGGVRIDGHHTPCRAGGSAAECDRTRDAGTPLILSAEPDGGYVFAGWTGDCAVHGSNPDLNLTFDRDLNCGATFELSSARTIFVTVSGSGRVHNQDGLINCRENGSVDDCSESYAQLETVTLTAQPDPQQTFMGWGGTCAQFGASPQIQLETLGSHNCTATFSVASSNPTLTVQIRNGSLEALVESLPDRQISCTAASGSDCSQQYTGLTEVLLVATPGWNFVRWEGCGDHPDDEIVDQNACRLTLDVSRTIIAEFASTPP